MTTHEIYVVILHVTSVAFDDVCAGFEEEGVPYIIAHEAEEQNGINLATLAAQRSPLQVGIGIAADGTLYIQHEKLPPHTPYLQGHIDDGRRAGKNAARLVKGLPLSIGERMIAYDNTRTM